MHRHLTYSILFAVLLVLAVIVLAVAWLNGGFARSDAPAETNLLDPPVRTAHAAPPGDRPAPGGDRTDFRQDATLRALAEQRGVQIGAAAGTGLPARDTAYAAVLAREFGLLTAENAMKFGPLRPARDTFRFEQADALVAFAGAHGMQVRGHTLVWHNQLPDWLTDTAWSREELMEILRTHITTVVGRYKGRVAAWDVVNEAVVDDGSMRRTPWFDAIGPAYIALAFRWAHEADPDALLFYNDYGAEGSRYGDEGRGQKSDSVYALVRGLVEDGVPIHGVGLQMHVATQAYPAPEAVADNMRRLAELGLEVQITEMDVRIPLPASEADLAQQAEVYRMMTDVCLQASRCTAIVVWGFTDRYSWIPGFFEGYGAALIFDEAYAPKPAYGALQRALAETG